MDTYDAKDGSQRYALNLLMRESDLQHLISTTRSLNSQQVASRPSPAPKTARLPKKRLLRKPLAMLKQSQERRQRVNDGTDDVVYLSVWSWVGIVMQI